MYTPAFERNIVSYSPSGDAVFLPSMWGPASAGPGLVSRSSRPLNCHGMFLSDTQRRMTTVGRHQIALRK
jgi:hypothetical protein